MKRRIVLFSFFVLIIGTAPVFWTHSAELIQQEPVEETVQDSVSIDDADPIFYDAEEMTEDIGETPRERNPLTWALYLGGAAIIIIIVAVILRRSKKNGDEE